MQWCAAGHICDMAIIDMHMPVLDGLTLAMQMRQQNMGLPVLLMTSLGERIADDAVAGRIFKPLKQRPLYDRINSILSLNRAADESDIPLYK